MNYYCLRIFPNKSMEACMQAFKHLYNDFKPENYHIFLDVNRETKQFSGEVTVTGEALTRDLAFHQKDLAITSVLVDGQAVDFTLDEASETVAFAIAKTGKVAVAFSYLADLTEQLLHLEFAGSALKGELAILLACALYAIHAV